MYELRENIFELKSSFAKKESERNSSAATMHSKKQAYFHLERKNAYISYSYDKLLAKFDAYHKAAGQSKFEVVIDVYKLGYVNCMSATAPSYAIGDEDIEMPCPNLLHVQSKQISTVDVEGVEEQAADKAVTKEGEAEEGVTNEMVADAAEQTVVAAKGAIDHMDAERAR